MWAGMSANSIKIDMANTPKTIKAIKNPFIGTLKPSRFGRLYRFFFPDDTKLKIEASTDVYFDGKKLHIHRRFFTFRALASFSFWYVTKNPYEKAKKYLEDVQENPAYAMRFAGAFAVFLLVSLLDIKNISNMTLIAGAIAYDAQASTTGSTSPITFSHTTSGSDRGLVVTTGGLRNPTAITYNSVSMTEAISVTPFDTSRVECWTLLNPASGSNTVSCTLASDGSTGLGAVSFSGVDSFGNTAGSGTTSDTTRTNTIYTKKANSFIVESQWKDNASSITQNSSQTELFDNNVGGSRHATAYSQLVAAGGVSLQFTGAGSASLIGHALVEVIEKTATTQISLDATSQKTDVSSRETSFTWSHTCSGANRVLVVNIFSADRHPTGVTYNGDSLTQIEAQANFGYQSTWILVAPDTGANNIVVSFSSSSYCTAQAISLNGANGYSATAEKYEQDNSTNEITTSITLAGTGSWTIENQQSGAGSGSGLVENSSQGKWGQANHGGNDVVAGAYKSHSTSGSKSLSYSLNWTGSTEMQRHIIVEITAGDQSTNVTAEPTTQALTFSIPSYATTQGVTISPSTQSIAASVPAYSVLLGVTIQPSTQALSLSIPTYDVLTPDALATPNTPSASFSIPTYAVALDFAFGVNTQSATFSIPAYSILQGAGFAASAQSLTFSIPAYSIGLGSIVEATVQEATFSIPAYSIVPETRVVASEQAMTFSIPTYSVLLSSTITVATQVLTFTIATLKKVGAVWTKRGRSTNSTWSRSSRNSD